MVRECNGEDEVDEEWGGRDITYTVIVLGCRDTDDSNETNAEWWGSSRCPLIDRAPKE